MRRPPRRRDLARRVQSPARALPGRLGDGAPEQLHAGDAPGGRNAAKSENVKITPFDTGFTAQKQFSVIQDIVALHKYQGILVQPNDSVGIEPAIKQAIKAGIQVVTLNVPIGPSSTTISHAIARPGRIGANAPGDVGSSAWANDGKRL